MAVVFPERFSGSRAISASSRYALSFSPPASKHEVAYRHSLAIRKPPTVPDRAADRDVPVGTELGAREHFDDVVFGQRKVVEDRAGGVGERRAQLNAASSRPSSGSRAPARDRRRASGRQPGERRRRSSCRAPALGPGDQTLPFTVIVFRTRSATGNTRTTIAGLERNERRCTVAQRLGLDVDGHPIAAIGRALRRRQNALDLHAPARGRRRESAGRPNEVRERLVRLELVRRRTNDLADDSNAQIRAGERRRCLRSRGERRSTRRRAADSRTGRACQRPCRRA